MVYEIDLLPYCRLLIERKLEWGNSKHWQNNDFEQLSKLIFNETGVSLSISTLKRLWGRVQYNSSPTPATLDALAKFVGYDSWRTFRLDAPHSAIPAAPAHNIKAPFAICNKQNLIVTSFGLIILIVLLYVFWSISQQKNSLFYKDVTFSSRFVTKSIPNTTVFQYQIGKSNADSVFVQQSWDPALRFQVNKHGKYFTSTYYYPGYYRAKLILNDSIVREHDIFITSHGWLGTVDQPSIPLYMRANVVEKQNGIISVTEADLLAIGVPLTNEATSVSLYKVDSSQIHPGDRFVFETAVQSTYNQGNSICQMMNIELLCTEGRHVIPLSTPGCVGNLNLVVANQEIDGRTNDLSGFGVEFSKWVLVRYEVVGKQAHIYINNRLTYQHHFDANPGKVIGFRYSFSGTGAVKYARLM